MYTVQERLRQRLSSFTAEDVTDSPSIMQSSLPSILEKAAVDSDKLSTCAGSFRSSPSEDSFSSTASNAGDLNVDEVSEWWQSKSSRHEVYVRLATRLFVLAGVSSHAAPVSDLAKYCSSTTEEAEEIVHKVLECIRYLFRLDYEIDEVENIVAHAALYLRKLVDNAEGQPAPRMEGNEVSYIACLLLYLGHSHVLDENCPLKYWHVHLFSDYCGIRQLNEAVMHLFQRLSFTLRLGDRELQDALFYLRIKTEARCVQKSAPSGKVAIRKAPWHRDRAQREHRNTHMGC
eukprot:gnl/TRDRNA2_/TRDRNA2_171376_c0_seq3.p1 gnl/TRDRNA2_/TRDRNA2_171376_c0~~gnl/TRDRNA2_/TRDRNA2_171376_c0_seq3.p1  ORF type:complete len:307 (+),score=37.54 gnl/TRDRNA2_/TRDRNA2_171376_c0_seq3:57-923(+)